MMVAGWESEPREEVLPILAKEVIPRDEMPSEEFAQRWVSFKRGVVAWWQRYVRGYAWDQIDRLREAKLQDVETISEERRAAAEAKRAEARKLDAEAERIYAEAEQIRLDNLERRLSIEQAYSELENAIRAIQRRGGDVRISESAPESRQQPQSRVERRGD